VTFRPNFSVGLAFYISIIEKQKMKVNCFNGNCHWDWCRRTSSI